MSQGRVSSLKAQHASPGARIRSQSDVTGTKSRPHRAPAQSAVPAATPASGGDEQWLAPRAWGRVGFDFIAQLHERQEQLDSPAPVARASWSAGVASSKHASPPVMRGQGVPSVISVTPLSSVAKDGAAPGAWGLGGAGVHSPTASTASYSPSRRRQRRGTRGSSRHGTLSSPLVDALPPASRRPGTAPSVSRRRPNAKAGRPRSRSYPAATESTGPLDPRHPVSRRRQGRSRRDKVEKNRPTFFKGSPRR